MVLLWGGLQLPLGAESPEVVDHVVLVDVSGSMRTRGYATREAWSDDLTRLLTELLKPEGAYFGADSQATLQPFSDPATDLKENRRPIGPFGLAELPQQLPQMAPPGAGATDMSRALDIARELRQRGSHKALTWLITDNENNFTSNQSDRAFYERLRDSDEFSHVFLFPLAQPDKRAQDSLVMYLLVPPDSLEMEDLNLLAKQVEERTGFGGMLFRPLYQQNGVSSLDFSKELTLEARGKHRVEQEGGQTVLYFDEGEKLEGQLRFRIRSRLRGWKVQGASLEDAEVSLNIPRLYGDYGARSGQAALSKLHWQVTPKTLEVESEKDSLTMFSLRIEGPQGKPIRLQRSTAETFKNPFARYLPEITGDVKMRAILHIDQGELKPQVPPEMQERLKTVPRLAEIEEYMLQQSATEGEAANQRELEFQRKLVVRVKADPSSAVLIVLLLAGAGLLGLALLAAVLLWKVKVQVEGPGVEEEVSLSALFGEYLICDGKGLGYCRLRSRGGSLQLAAEPDFAFEDDAKQQTVQWQGGEFRFEAGPEGKPREVFWLRKSQGGGSSSGGADNSSPL